MMTKNYISNNRITMTFQRSLRHFPTPVSLFPAFNEAIKFKNQEAGGNFIEQSEANICGF